jgi:hypothetical protein
MDKITSIAPNTLTCEYGDTRTQLMGTKFTASEFTDGYRPCNRIGVVIEVNVRDLARALLRGNGEERAEKVNEPLVASKQSLDALIRPA